MQPARIAELLDPFLGPDTGGRLTANDLEAISTYIDILLRWNARVNLTAIRDPDEIVTRHFGESLFAARHLFPRTINIGPDASSAPAERSEAVKVADEDQRAATHNHLNFHITELHPPSLADRGRAALLGPRPDASIAWALAPAVADLGSGAGFPGIPIKLWAPHIALTLIESNYKKAAFLREVTRALTLMNVNIQNARAESLPRASFDVVTFRAVERFEATLPVAARLVAPAGRLTLLIGAAQLDLAHRTLPHLTWSAPSPIPRSRSRILVVAHDSP